MKSWILPPMLGAALVASAAFAFPEPAQAAEEKRAILLTYADIAHAGYEDSLIRARELQTTVEALIENPSEQAMAAARAAWLAARDPYMQTEVFRFGNAVVDDWEGKVNAWPLDEGLIDYVAPAYGESSEDNPAYTANVIANSALRIGGESLDTSVISKRLLEEQLQELGGIEANVATGYHAIEFLLWGQDLNGTKAGAGQRSWKDYASGENCANGSCERRARYLSTVTELLIDDLAWMTAQWAPEGAARSALLQGDPDEGLARILTGIGSLSYGELAGERMQLGLMLHDPEEEHDCFSDNTHNSHYFDVAGMLNVYTGTYTRIDGRKVIGPAVSHLAAERAPEANAVMLAKLKASEAAMGALKRRGDSVEAYDQMLGVDNPEGNAVVQAAIDALTAQTRALEAVVAELGLEPIAVEGSDSLDNPEAVFQ